MIMGIRDRQNMKTDKSEMRTSRRETPDQPGIVCLPGVTEAVVEAVCPALPEFNAGGGKQIPPPMRWPGNIFSGVLRFHLLPVRFKPIYRPIICNDAGNDDRHRHDLFRIFGIP